MKTSTTYFVLMYLVALYAIEKALPITEWLPSYNAVLQWILLFAIGSWIQERRQEQKEEKNIL